MAVWTLKMNIIDKTDVFEFCKSENLIGFGWGLPDKNNKNNDAIMTITDYQKIKAYLDFASAVPDSLDYSAGGKRNHFPFAV